MKKITTFIFTLIIVNNCFSQNIQPTIKTKLESLYPHANVVGGGWNNDNTQNVVIDCNCPEFSGEMKLTFDTNAKVLIKTFYFWSLKDLPDNILNYMKKNTSKTVNFVSGYFKKFINYNGDVGYSIRMSENNIWYDIKFKDSGEVISKTKEMQYKE